MKWTYEELNAATKAVLDPAYVESHAITEAAQAKVDAILEEAGWTRWEWIGEEEPSVMGAGPMLRDADKKASTIRKIMKALYIIYKYDQNASIATEHDEFYVGSSDLYAKMSQNDKCNLEELYGFFYNEKLESWRKSI